MTNLGLLLFLSTVAVAQAVDVGSRTVDIITSLAHTKFEEWSAAFISTNDKILGNVLPATLFVPPAATDEYNVDRRVAAYHVVPGKMEFSDLLAKKDKTRVRTLLGGFSILVRNTSEGGLTLDGVNVTEPDMYVNSFMAIHRIAHQLDFKTYGSSHFKPTSKLPPRSQLSVFAFVLITLVVCFISWICFSRR